MEVNRIGRLVGWGPIVAIVLAGGLAVAGYGVPVGVGLLAGAALGFGVGFIVAISIPGPRSFAVLNRRRGGGWTSVDPLQTPGHDQLMVNHQRADVIEEASFVRVIPGPLRAEASGIAFDLIALELRETGGILHFAGRLGPDAPRPGGLAHVTISDDLGTVYTAGGFQTGGSQTRLRFEVAVAPAPPAEAGRLKIAIDELTNPYSFPPDIPAPARTADVRGPWVFEVDLAVSR